MIKELARIAFWLDILIICVSLGVTIISEVISYFKFKEHERIFDELSKEIDKVLKKNKK